MLALLTSLLLVAAMLAGWQVARLALGDPARGPVNLVLFFLGLMVAGIPATILGGLGALLTSWGPGVAVGGRVVFTQLRLRRRRRFWGL